MADKQKPTELTMKINAKTEKRNDNSRDPPWEAPAKLVGSNLQRRYFETGNPLKFGKRKPFRAALEPPYHR